MAGAKLGHGNPALNTQLRTRGLLGNRRKCLSTGVAVSRHGFVGRLGVPIRVETRQFLPQCGDHGCDATTHPWRKLHQPLDRAPAFRAGDKLYALIDRQRRGTAALSVLFLRPKAWNSRTAIIRASDCGDGEPTMAAGSTDRCNTVSELLGSDRARSFWGVR